MADPFILAPVDSDTGVTIVCPECGSSFLLEVTFYSLNGEDEGEPCNG